MLKSDEILKDILLVGNREAFETLAEALNPPFVPSFADNLDMAYARIDAADPAAMIIVHDVGFGMEVSRFLEAVKQRHEAVATVHVGGHWARSSADCTFQTMPDPESIASLARELLYERMWPSDLVKQVTDGATATLTDFGLNVQPAQPRLKANRRLLGRMTSLVNFFGEGISGYIAVSASPEVLAAAWSRSTGRRSDAVSDAADAGSEIGNRCTQGVKQYFAARGVELYASLPLLLDAWNAILRPARRASLVVPLHADIGTVFVELWWDRLDGAVLELDVDKSTDIIGSSEMVFF